MKLNKRKNIDINGFTKIKSFDDIEMYKHVLYWYNDVV